MPAFHSLSMHASAILLLAVCFSGCQSCPNGGCIPSFGPRKHATYVSQRVFDETCPFRGVPVQIYKPYGALVTIEKADGTAQKSIHFILLPDLYAVDIQKAFFGITDAKVLINNDGQLNKFDANIDQEIPEILTSISQILEALPLDPELAAMYRETKKGAIAKNTFEPPLPSDGRIIDVQWSPLGQ